MTRKLLIVLLLFVAKVHAQKENVKIVEEKKGNKIQLYIVNESYTDYDVKLTVEGTGFKQSRNAVKFTRLPAASKLLYKNLIVMRGKTPNYKFNLEVNEELNKRSLRKPVQKIIVYKKLKKPVTVYVTEKCVTCDSIIAKLDRDHYIYNKTLLSEKPAVAEQLGKLLGSRQTPLSELTNPLISIGGYYFTKIDSIDKLLEEVNKE